MRNKPAAPSRSVPPAAVAPAARSATPATVHVAGLQDNMLTMQRTFGNAHTRQFKSIQLAAANASTAPSPSDVPAQPLELQAVDLDAIQWLAHKAEKEGKRTLFDFLQTLHPAQQKAAIDLMAGGSNTSLDKFKKQMKKGIISKSVDWDKFSTAVRTAKKLNTTNYLADTAKDYTSYTFTGTSGAATGVKGSSDLSYMAGASSAKAVAATAAPLSSGLGALGSLTQVYGGASNVNLALNSGGENVQSAMDSAAGLADATRSTADTVKGGTELAGQTASGALAVVAGAGAVVAGTAYMVQGAAGYASARSNLKKLEGVKTRLGEREDGDAKEQLTHSADLAEGSQKLKKSTSAVTVAKGALMAAGGIVLLAAAASPVGPILLAAAALLGGIYAVVKYFKKKSQREAFVDKYMKLDQEMAREENKGRSRDAVRQKLVEQHGFNSVAQCYAQIVADLAQGLYTAGVQGSDAEAGQIIESIGLKINPQKGTPTVDAIAKKLSI